MQLKEKVFAGQAEQEGCRIKRTMFTKIPGLERLGEAAHSNCSGWLKMYGGKWWPDRSGEILKDYEITETVFTTVVSPKVSTRLGGQK